MRYMLWCIYIFYSAISFSYALILFCDVKMCPEAAHFWIEPLQDDEDSRESLDKKVATNVFARVPPSSKDQASQPTTNIEARDENRAETDETKWCHICFYIFIRKQKRIQKRRKQI
jgi:hypothetical protein